MADYRSAFGYPFFFKAIGIDGLLERVLYFFQCAISLHQPRVRGGSAQFKNRLLLESAPEDDEKQTALIETAWIAKLAQSLASLKYGHTPGAEDEKRFVTVISGMLTAKVRKKYKLNSILYKELPDDADIEDLPKNRQDSRHHALDAMVLVFLPQWARDINKREFFKFPQNVLKNPKDYFSTQIERVTPYYICREKPVLEETFYAQRTADNKPVMVKRVELLSLPYKGKSFNAAEGVKQTDFVLDVRIKNDLKAFFAGVPDEVAWKDFVSLYRFSPNGPSVRKLSMLIGDPAEYCNISKGASLPSAARGQYKRAKSHNGYFIYIDKDKPKVKPVYVFQSKNKVKEELLKAGFPIYGFFCSNCLIEIEQDIDLGNRIIPKGRYVCSSIFTDGRAKLKGIDDFLKNPISLKCLINAGFKRVL